MELLGKIFGGVGRVKIIRLFLLNEGKFFLSSDIALRAKISRTVLRRDITMLESIGFIKRRTRGGVPVKKTKKKKSSAQKKVVEWGLNTQFKFLDQFKQLFIDPIVLAESLQLSRFRPIGRLRLVLAAGVFTGDAKSRADLLIVVDTIKRKPLESMIKTIESEIGKEVTYAAFTTEDYYYRLSMFDRLVCDFIELPHLELFKHGEFSTPRSKKV